MEQIVEASWFEWFRQLAIIIMTLAAGGPGAVWLVDRLKEALNLSGKPVFFLAAGVSAVVAAASLIVDGVLLPGAIRPDNFAEIALGLFTVSQVYYRMIVQQESDPPTFDQPGLP